MKKIILRIIIIAIFFTGTLKVVAFQDNLVNELKQQIINDNINTKKTTAYNIDIKEQNLIWAWFKLWEFKQNKEKNVLSINELQTIISVFNKHTDIEGEIIARIPLGNRQWKEGNTKASYESFNRVIYLLETRKSLLNQDFYFKYLVKAKILRSTNNLELKKLDRVKEDIFELEELLVKVKNTKLKLNVLSNLAQLNSMLKNSDEAIKINRQIISLAKKEKIHNALSVSLGNLATEKARLGKLDSAVYYLKEALRYDKKHNITKGVIAKQINIGIMLTMLKKYKESENYFNKAIANAKTDNNLSLLAKASGKKTQLLINTNRYREAIDLGKETLIELKQQERLEMTPEIYKNLMLSYLKTGKKDSVLFFFKKREHIRDSLLEVTRKSKINDLNVKYQTQKKEKENLKLKQETAEKDLNIANKNNIILIISLSFGLIILLLISYQLIKFRAKNKALKDSIEEREKIEKELAIVRDNIAKDFHDDLGNKLARIATLSDLMISTSDNRDKENIIKALKSIKMDSDVLYKGTRDFMFSLKANSDYIEELFTYLSDFGEEFFESFNIDFFVEKHIQENIKLPYYWTRQIIMIFKEAMTNAVKHSSASIVTLVIRQEKGSVYIALIDNGSGFDYNKIDHKNGLLNMESRANKIQANLRVETNNLGTTIAFNAQLKNV